MAYLGASCRNLLWVACLATASCATGQGDSNIRDPNGTGDGAATGDAVIASDGAVQTGDGDVSTEDAPDGDIDVPPGTMDSTVPGMDAMVEDMLDAGMTGMDAGMMTAVDTGVDTGVIVTEPDTGPTIIDSGVPVDTGVPADTGVPTDTGPAPLVCLEVIVPTTCGSGYNCCVSVLGVGAGCGCTPLPGIFPCVPGSCD